MEEQKDKGKKAKMEAIKTENQELTYDKLKNVANSLYEENRYLRQEIYKKNETINMFERLDYLLKVVELSQSDKSQFDAGFIAKCYEEIQVAMTPVLEEEEETSQEN